jgi:hypothetical protein
MNVVPLRDHNPPIFRRMQSYYRNIALWLATPAQRVSMLVAATWGATVASEPMDFDIQMDLWELGQRALDVIGRSAPQCTISDWVSTAQGVAASMAMAADRDERRRDPLGPTVPTGVAERAIVGGIALGLRDLAFDYHRTRALGDRPFLRPDDMRERAVNGAREGNRALANAIASHAPELGRFVDEAFDPPAVGDIRIAVETLSLQVTAERVQFADARDPALADGMPAIGVALWLDGREVGRQLYERVGESNEYGVSQLGESDSPLPSLIIQSGQTLTIKGEPRRPRSAPLRATTPSFRDSLRGDPTAWLGSHVPSRSQPLRLWYRIDSVRPVEAN